MAAAPLPQFVFAAYACDPFYSHSILPTASRVILSQCKPGHVYLWSKISFVLMNPILPSSSSAVLLLFSHTDLLSFLIRQPRFCYCVSLKCFAHPTSICWDDRWIYGNKHIVRCTVLAQYAFAEYLNEKRRVGFS